MPIAAVLQMSSTAVVADNLATARSLLEQARNAGAALAVLPENFALMGRHESDKLAAAEAPGSGPIQDMLASTAARLGLWIIGGTIPLQVEGESRVAAACLVFDDVGRAVARYDKIHLFDVDLPGRNERYRESATMVPGREPVVVSTPVGKVGLAVCYDVRFPELFRELESRGAEVFSLPAAFTGPTGRAHWDVLLRARAIENLAWMLAAAQWGRHDNGRETYGHSLIASPWGEVLSCQPDGTGVVVADIEPEQQQDIRTRFPALNHRRLRQPSADS